jgi:uncharacterized OB-fold protein
MTRHLYGVPDPPRGWTPAAWARAYATARRAHDADRLARETFPPAKVGFVEFNQARGRIMAELDRQADSNVRSGGAVESLVNGPAGAGDAPGPGPTPTKEVRA